MLVVMVLVAAAGVSLAMLPRHATTPAQPVAATAEELDAPASQVAVVDGGTLRLRDRVVRLQGVEPPARGTACASADCGAAATNALAAMVREVPVSCRLTGADRMRRPYAVCQASGTELNRAVIAAGWGRADGGPPLLKDLEATARAERRGVWASDGGASW